MRFSSALQSSFARCADLQLCNCPQGVLQADAQRQRAHSPWHQHRDGREGGPRASEAICSTGTARDERPPLDSSSSAAPASTLGPTHPQPANGSRAFENLCRRPGYRREELGAVAPAVACARASAARIVRAPCASDCLRGASMLYIFLMFVASVRMTSTRCARWKKSCMLVQVRTFTWYRGCYEV
jgi:hypothetical protein